MKNLSFLFSCILATSYAYAHEIDCSEAYNGEPARCAQVACDEKYQSFIGTWSGPFAAYEETLSTPTAPVFRPFKNTVTYSESDCLRNVSNGDTFIIGRRIDDYPAFNGLEARQDLGLLITGKHADSTPFLKTINPKNPEEGKRPYNLVYQNKIANLSIWTVTYPKSDKSPEMRFTTIDGQDFIETSAHKRNVTVTLSVGPIDSPFWEGVVTTGHHILKK